MIDDDFANEPASPTSPASPAAQSASKPEVSSALSFLHEKPEVHDKNRTQLVSDTLRLNEKQQYALDIVNSGESVFITGPSGSGKSAIIPVIVRELRARGDKVSVTCAA